MVYVSTGGFRGKTANEVTGELISAGIEAIELSGGAYSETLLQDLQVLAQGIKFQIHNYFPPPEAPFVLNLGSLDPAIGTRSIAHVEKALEWCGVLGSDRYSFHAGFLLDPKVDELGRRIHSRHLFNRDDCIETFINRVTHVAEIAQQTGIAIMIENNVLSAKNALEFSANPLLMTDPQECQKIMRRMPENVRLLIDVAHLKVSARSQDFHPARMFDMCHEWIAAYHLSDNDGQEDSNLPFTEDAWFWPYLKTDVGYYSVEVYGGTPEKLFQQVELLRSKLKSGSE
jgi:sugar phosphate isomerase/epimerase